MSDSYDELGRTFRTLLHEEAEAMEIDTNTASERLARELTPDPRRRWAGMVALGVAAAVVAAVVVTLLWSGGSGGRHAVPADVLETPSPSGETIVGSPYFVELATLERTPAPEALAEIYADSFFLWFSSNGDRIAYSTCLDQAGLCSADDRSYMANADGTGQQQVRLADGGNGYVKAWSPDDTKLLLQVRNGGSTDVGNLFLYDLNSGDATQLTDLNVSQGYWHIMAGFSPDGGQVVYDLARPPGIWPSSPTDVWSVPATGGAPSRLFRDGGQPAYLADGRVAFLRDDASILAAEPGEQPSGLLESDGFRVSPDGTRIAYAEGDDLFVLDIVSGESRELGKAGDWVWAGNDRLLVMPTE